MSRDNETKVLMGAGMGLAATSAAFFLYYRLTQDDGKKGTKKAMLQLSCPPGLTNVGNTCFANSLLQGLASCNSMGAWLCRCSTCDIDPINKNTPFIDALQQTLSNLNESGIDCLSAVEVVQSLQQHGWIVPVGMQQDLYELLHVFITTWDEQLLRCPQPTMSLAHINTLLSSSSKSIIQARLLVVTHDLLYKVALRPPCSGTVAIQLQCLTCGHKRVRQECFAGAISLNLAKPTLYGSVPLLSCLKGYFSAETLSGVACDRCTVTQPHLRCPATKTMGLSRFPQCLILRINREFYLPNGIVMKQQDPVSFSPKLDLDCFAFYPHSKPPPKIVRRGILGGCSTNQLSLQKLVGPIITPPLFRKPVSQSRNVYELQAVSEHIGAADYGHYITYRRGLGKKGWFKMSDSQVTPVSIDNVLSCQA